MSQHFSQRTGLVFILFFPPDDASDEQHETQGHCLNYISLTSVASPLYTLLLDKGMLAVTKEKY